MLVVAVDVNAAFMVATSERRLTDTNSSLALVDPHHRHQHRLLTDSKCPPVGRRYIMNPWQAKEQAGRRTGGKGEVQRESTQTGGEVYLNPNGKHSRQTNSCRFVVHRNEEKYFSVS